MLAEWYFAAGGAAWLTLHDNVVQFYPHSFDCQPVLKNSYFSSLNYLSPKAILTASLTQLEQLIPLHTRHATMVQYNQDTAHEIERSYITPEVAQQRVRTSESLALRGGDHVLDVGCGTGFLAREMAITIGPAGRVVGIDSSPDMLEVAAQRCAGLAQVSFKQGLVEQLPEQDHSFDALACVQVLLYVDDIVQALAEMYRVLKPGGRIAVLETDWRGTVLNSSNPELTGRMLRAWDAAVPSPNLPPRLGPLLRSQGFGALRVEAIPILNPSYAPDNFAVGALEWIARYALEQGAVTAAEAGWWLEDLKHLGEKGEFFFCINRFLFSAVRF